MWRLDGIAHKCEVCAPGCRPSHEQKLSMFRVSYIISDFATILEVDICIMHQKYQVITCNDWPSDNTYQYTLKWIALLSEVVSVRASSVITIWNTIYCWRKTSSISGTALFISDLQIRWWLVAYLCLVEICLETFIWITFWAQWWRFQELYLG